MSTQSMVDADGRRRSPATATQAGRPQALFACGRRIVRRSDGFLVHAVLGRVRGRRARATRRTAMKASAQMQIEPKSSRRKVISRGSLACAVLALAVAALSASQALATAAPAATTGPAQQVQFASATVSGTVNPSGAATSYYFEYGSTSAYGVQTSPTSAGAGTANVAVQQTLSGLAASTTYHYRLVATSPGGTAYGQDATFATTPTPAPAVTTGTATSVSFASASLTGSVNPEGVPTTYYFQYGATLAYGAKTAVESAASGTAPQAVTAPITGLAPATTYHYRLVAASAGGTVVGADATLTTTKTPAPLGAGGHRRGDGRGHHVGNRQRHGQPERGGQRLLLPVRDDVQLRPQHAVAVGGIGDRRGVVQRSAERSRAGDDIPLPRRGGQRRRHRRRPRCDLCDGQDARADGCHRRGQRRHHDDRESGRNDRSARHRHQLLLPLRDEVAEHAYANSLCRCRHSHRRGQRGARQPRPRHYLLIPARRRRSQHRHRHDPPLRHRQDPGASTASPTPSPPARE